MDTTAYYFDSDTADFGQKGKHRDSSRRSAVSHGPSATSSNPYGRSTWSKPESAGSGRGGVSRSYASGDGRASSAARGAMLQRRRSRKPAPAAAPDASAGVLAAMLGGLARTGRAARGLRVGRRRWKLWSVLGVAGLSAFVVVAVFQMASLYAEGLGLSGPAVASPTADAAPAVPAATDAAGEADPASTPRDEWRGGQLPFLYQTDPQFRDTPYAGATVKEAGCGPTSLSMVYIALTGKTDKDPAAMAAFSENGGYVEGNLTAWRLMTDGAAELGLSSHEVPADAGCLKAELAQGRPVICSVRPGDFTDTGHFLVVAGVADNGELVIHDPNSPDKSARTWDVERVLSQCANLWAFERA